MKRVSISPEETLIVGAWQMVDGTMVPDSELLRIRTLVSTELEHVAASSSGWEMLYRDPRDGRYWEKFYPNSEMHGGGPESLRVLDDKTIQQKYGITQAG